MRDHLDRLESRSIHILREARARFKRIALLWSIGKDSTALLWLARKAFFGKLPFPVLHIDTGRKFQEIYDFRDEYAERWGLDLLVARNESAIRRGTRPEDGKLECCGALKTAPLKSAIRKHRFQALFLGIRRDEHGIRAKERVFSPRDEDFRWDYRSQPAELWDLYREKSPGDQHLRIHPLLHWTELDVWMYVRREKIPLTSLYFAKKGVRYRSIGCEPCCSPVESKARTVSEIIRELRVTREAERSGRAQDKEDAYTMQKLRSLGYM